MGDGINDASAIHAVDVAKDAADIALLEKDLGVLEEGVKEGRVTFPSMTQAYSNTTCQSANSASNQPSPVGRECDT